jgi:hypothetical protein
VSMEVMQERAGAPSICTVQAPHSAMPQPNFVPVIPSTSRKTHNRGVSPSTSTIRLTPLTLIVVAIITSRQFVSNPVSNRIASIPRLADDRCCALRSKGAHWLLHRQPSGPQVPTVPRTLARRSASISSEQVAEDPTLRSSPPRASIRCPNRARACTSRRSHVV